MSEYSSVHRKARNLMDQAFGLRGKGKYEDALVLMDKAISLLENNDLDPYFYKIQKELLLLSTSSPKSRNGLISVTKEALGRYENQNPVKEIDTLLQLVGWLVQEGNKQNSLEYLDKAEELLTSYSSDQLDKYIEGGTYFSGRIFRSLRLREVNKIRNHLSNIDN